MVGRGHPLFAGDLLGDAGARVGLVHPPLAHEPLDRRLDREVDDDDGVERLLAGDGHQRRVEHDDVVGVALGLDAPGDLGAHGGMDDAVEIGEGRVVVEGDRRQTGAVELAVGADDRGPEALGELIEERAAGPLQLVDDGVGVDDHRAERGEAL